jgi:periplasmic protein CpxP/Spy
MKSSILLSMIAAGAMIAAAQQPSPATGQTQAQPQRQTQGQAAGRTPGQAKAHYRMMGGPMLHRLTRELNLTPDQQTQARTIFEQARQQAQSLNPKLREERQEMTAAIKSDNEAQIDQVTRQDAPLDSRARAIHAKAMAKVYAMLTPDQKARFDQMGASRRAEARGRRQAS